MSMHATCIIFECLHKVHAYESSLLNLTHVYITCMTLYSFVLKMGQRILWTAVPVFVSFLSFLTYVAIGNELTAAKAFTSIALFNLLRFPLNVFPMMISLITESAVALSRIRVSSTIYLFIVLNCFIVALFIVLIFCRILLIDPKLLNFRILH